MEWQWAEAPDDSTHTPVPLLGVPAHFTTFKRYERTHQLDRLLQKSSLNTQSRTSHSPSLTAERTRSSQGGAPRVADNPTRRMSRSSWMQHTVNVTGKRRDEKNVLMFISLNLKMKMFPSYGAKNMVIFCQQNCELSVFSKVLYFNDASAGRSEVMA